MDLVNPITAIVSCVMDCSTKHLNYLCALEEKLNQLKEKMEQLNEIKIDVKNKVIAAEAQLMVRTNQVNGWMQRVEVMRLEVDQILLGGTQQLERRCLNGCCPLNCWSSYKFGKKVVKKLLDVETLKDDGVFEIVADSPPLALTQELPMAPTVGLDSIFDSAWNILGENSVRIIGLCGMGGVGKTTLLKKINNEFGKRRSDFDIVIWVVISKEVNMVRVQEEVGKKLRLSSFADASSIFNVLKTKKFLLLLDDVWEGIDLLSIGIPSPSSQNKSKIMFTTRSEAVCGYMEADKIIRVECLNWEASSTLFKDKVGYTALSSDSDIPKLAEGVANECCGLPLALITIGRSMASKKTRQEWEHAILVLRNSAAEFPGMGDDVLPLLKFSYDYLPNDTIRSCFLFCSLYQEDFSIIIVDLIEQWIGEGYIDRFDDFDEALNTGHYIIGILKDACLLEEGDGVENDSNSFVKMHDVIRDLALWIACECGKEKDKYFVKAGLGLRDAPKAWKWPITAGKVSLVWNDITRLENIPKCPNLQTLLVSHNGRLGYIHDDFFLSMPALRVLDLSNTGIVGLPTSICELFKLEFLDLSCTKITSLPYQMRKLTKLKYLYLNFIFMRIPSGIIMNLSNLEFLKLDVQIGSFDIGELRSLKQLKSLEIRMFSNTKDVEMFLKYPQLANCARSLSIITCNDIASLAILTPSSSSSDLCLGHLKSLRNLTIFQCSNMKELKLLNKEPIQTVGLYESLERMNLESLPKLTISWDARNLESAHFRKLRFVKLNGCHAMADLTWLLAIPNLQTLWIRNCGSLQEIISSDGASNGNTFSNLKLLELDHLPNLCSICCMSALPFPSLVTITVDSCPKLRRLPFDSNSANNTLQRISGKAQWWDILEWENEAINIQFAKFFKPSVF